MVKEDVLVGEIEKIITKHGEGLVENIELFDIYRGNPIPEGMKSVAFSIIFRSHSRTLRDEEINTILETIIKDLEDTFDAKLRA